jgi:hypothetical protein
MMTAYLTGLLIIFGVLKVIDSLFCREDLIKQAEDTVVDFSTDYRKR